MMAFLRAYSVWHAILLALAWAFALALAPASASAQHTTQVTGAFSKALALGVALRAQGELNASLEQIKAARMMASSELERRQSAAELAVSLMQSRRLADALPLIQEAYQQAQGPERAEYALILGQLGVLQKDRAQAEALFAEAVHLSSPASPLYLRAQLSLARQASPPSKPHDLMVLFDLIAALAPSPEQSALFLSLGHLAQAQVPPATRLAYQSLERARESANSSAAPRLRLEVADAMAQLYEDQQQFDDAAVLNQQALVWAAEAPARELGDLWIALEWREARLHGHKQRPVQALAAYQRAVARIEAVRLDIPIDYDDGRSSFATTFEPVYLGLVDALLVAADSASAERRQNLLRQAVETLELTRQAELQDYMGDRCTVDAVKGGTATVLPAHTAVLYPVLLGVRTELLLETRDGISRLASTASAQQVRASAALLASDLRVGATDYLPRAQQLYNALLRPLEATLAAHAITTLVVVPDGALRLVPLGALHDGSRFAIEKYAVTSVTGLSMTNTEAPPAWPVAALVAGASSFGPVVEKFSQTAYGRMMGNIMHRQLDAGTLLASRAVRSPLGAPSAANAAPGATTSATQRQLWMREALALPGVRREVNAVSHILRGRRLLDEGFTIDAFSRVAQSGGYRLLHVASHGVFGGSADASFVMTFDELLTLDGLQSLLKGESFRRQPIELLTLSACETAEGDARAPLGLAGAAMKARAKSVLGTLWPVDDDAAVGLMENFYARLTGEPISKARALQLAQIDLLRSAGQGHPFVWAPFTLIGNWL